MQAFDASRPISGRSELFGRQREIEGLISSVFDFNQHAIVYGARGSGKTSVARVFGDFADHQGAIVLYFPCEPDANFSQLMGGLLDGLPQLAIAADKRGDFLRRLHELPADFGPLALVDLLAEVVVRPVILILDEFDRIAQEKVKTEIAVAMKLLSDTHTPVHIVLVGIASSVNDILTGHPSLRRHMSITRIGRIEPNSVNALIDHGASIAGLPFNVPARALIERISIGSPYHVRLLCRQAALHAMANRHEEVGLASVHVGVRQALEQWEATNPTDAMRFDELASNVAMRKELEIVAREAARFDAVAFKSTIATALDMLGDSLVPVASDKNSFTFADSLAPQFLISRIVLAELETNGEGAREGRVNVATS